MSTNERPLIPKQQRFVDEYLIDLNATRAAIAAGYSRAGATVRGSELLANRKVAAAIAERQQARAERTRVDVDWVIDNLTSLYRESRAKNDGAVAVRVLELLAKHVGLFEKHQKQKRQYTVEDIPVLKARLEASGWNYRDKSYEQKPSIRPLGPSTN